MFVYNISPEAWLQGSDEACKSKLRSFGGCICFFEVGGVDCFLFLLMFALVPGNAVRFLTSNLNDVYICIDNI